MAVSERDRRALILGGIALGVIGVYFLGIDPLWGWYDGLVTEHKTAAAAMKRIVADERKAKSYAERVAEFEEKVGELVPPQLYSKQISAASEKILNAAGPSGIKVQGSTPTSPVAWPDDPGLQQASIIIDAEGGWDNVFKFIGTLYRSEGILSVEQMELTGDPKKGGKMTIKLTVSVLIQAPEESDDQWAI